MKKTGVFGLGRKALAVYIGASMSRNSVPRMRGYIFPNGKYIFIPQVSDDQHAPGPTYRDLNLDDYVHPSYYGVKVHYDPEFETFTYGEYMGKADPYTKNLLRLKPNDYLFFITSLQFSPGPYRREWWVKLDWAYYIIGYFEIEEIFNHKDISVAVVQHKLRNNAHIIAGDKRPDLVIWKGSERSAKLEYAVPISDKNIPTSLACEIFKVDLRKKIRPRWWQTYLINENRLEKLWRLIKSINNIHIF